MRRRRSPAPSRIGSMFFALGCVTVLGVTFAAGMFAGRYWPQLLPSVGARPGREARRDARAAERTPSPPAPVLTFYRELTAPLTAPPPPPPRSRPARPAAKPATEPAWSAPPAAAEHDAAKRSAQPEAPAGDPPKPAAEQPERPTAAPTPAAPVAERYTVQVGAFKTREQAEAFRARLAGAGHDAYVADLEGTPGARYRVRVGAFASRDQAQHVAERLAAERFATYVTVR